MSQSGMEREIQRIQEKQRRGELGPAVPMDEEEIVTLPASLRLEKGNCFRHEGFLYEITSYTGNMLFIRCLTSEYRRRRFLFRRLQEVPGTWEVLPDGF